MYVIIEKESNKQITKELYPKFEDADFDRMYFQPDYEEILIVSEKGDNNDKIKKG